MVRYEEYQIPTLTVADAARILRGLGMHISDDTLRNGLEQGVFHFGFAIKTEKSHVYYIFEDLFEDWVVSRGEEKPKPKLPF